MLLAALATLGGIAAVDAQLALPDITDKSVNADSTLRLNMTAQNAEGPVTWSIDPPVEGARIHPISGHLVYLPPEARINMTQPIMVHADDGSGNANTTISVAVGDRIVSFSSVGTTNRIFTIHTGHPFLYFTSYNYYNDGVRTTFRDGMLIDPDDDNNDPFNFLANPQVAMALYYYEMRTNAADAGYHKDENVYAQFTPSRAGAEIIPNPNTRPAPVAPNITASVVAGTLVGIMPELVGMDGDTLVITGVTNGTKGTASHTDAIITYIQDGGAGVSDTITYTVTDDRGFNTTGTIDIEILSERFVLPDYRYWSMGVSATLRLDMAARHAEGPVAYRIDPAVDGARIHPITGHLVYLPPAGHVDTQQNITVHAVAGSDSDTKSISVDVGEAIGSVVITGDAEGNNINLTGVASALAGSIWYYHEGSVLPLTSLTSPHVAGMGSTNSFIEYEDFGTNPPIEGATYYYVFTDRSDEPSFDWRQDANIYARFTPHGDGSVVVPNPHTRPDPHAPSFDQDVITGVTSVIRPVLVGLDGGDITITAVTNGTGIAMHDDTTITYMSDAGAGATDTITYTVTDNRGVSNTGTIDIEILSERFVLPDFQYQSLGLYETLRLNMSAYYAEGPVAYRIDPAVDGARIHPATGHLVYFPPAGHVDTQQNITVHAGDGARNVNRTINVAVGEAIGSVVITGTESGNDFALRGGPIAVAGSFWYYHEGVATSFSNLELPHTAASADAPNPVHPVIVYDFDANPPVEGATYYYVITARSDESSYDWRQDGNIYVRFTPNEDGAVAVPNPHTRQDHVAPDFEQRVLPNTPTTITPDIVRIDGDTLVITAVTNGTIGTTAPSGDAIIYTPHQDRAGRDTITYTIADDRGVAATGTINITIQSGSVSILDIEDQSTWVYSTVRIPIEIENASGPVTYSIDPHEGAHIHPISGDLVYVPVPDHRGMQELTVYARDDITNVSKSIQVEVRGPIAIINNVGLRAEKTVTSVTISPQVAIEHSFESLSGNRRTNHGDIGNLGASGTRFVDSDPFNLDRHPAPNTLYYFEVARNGDNRNVDRNVYTSFTPGESEFERIANPNTRPAPVAPNIITHGVVAVPVTVTPELVDMDGGDITISGVTNGSKGTAEANATTITYTSHAGATGPDEITYTVIDDRGMTGTATVTIRLPSIILDDIEVEDAVAVSTTLRVPVTVQNATGPVTYGIDPPHEGAYIHPITGHLYYVPVDGQQGVQNITVTASDDADTARTIIQVSVTEPIATVITVKFSETVYEDAVSAQVPFANVSAGPQPVSSRSKIVTDGVIVGAAIGSTVDFDRVGPISLLTDPSPAPGKLYFFSLWDASATNGTRDDAIHVQFVPGQDDNFTTIANPYTRPALVLPDLEVAVKEGREQTIPLEIPGSDGNPTSMTVVTNGTKGETVPDGAAIVYTPGAGQLGADTITYSLRDNMGNTNSHTILITIEELVQPTFDVPPNTPGADAIEIPEGAEYSFDVTVTNPDEIEYALSVMLGEPAAENAAIDEDGTFRWTPAEEHGGASYNVTIILTPEETEPFSRQITLAVTETNEDPVFDDIDAVQNATAGEPFTLDLNATDDDRPAQALTYSIVNQSASTTNATIDPVSGIISWEPDESGTKTIRAAVHDNFTARGSDTLDITISVNGVPDADSINRTAVAGRPLSIDLHAEGLIADDGPIEDLDVSIPVQPSQGMADAAGAVITYTARDNATDTDTFNYTVTDRRGASASATVSITISDRPIVSGFILTGAPGLVLQADLVDDGHVTGYGNITAEITRDAQKGDARADGTTITYTANIGASGNDTFTYTATDGHGQSASAMVTVVIQQVTLVINDDDVQASPDMPVRIPVLRENSSIPDGVQVNITITDSPESGRIDIRDGVIIYTPESGNTDSQTITFIVSASGTTSDPVTIIIIFFQASAPTAASFGASVNQSATISIDLVSEGRINDNDQDPATLNVTIDDTPAQTQGVANVTGTVITYTARDNATGSDVIPYRVTDNDGLTGIGSINVFILAPGNTPPVLGDISDMTVRAGQTLEFNATASDTDVPAQTLSYRFDGTVPAGAAINNVTGYFSWMPAGNQTGNHPITITVSNGQGGTDSETFNVNVTGVITAPPPDSRPNPDLVVPDILINAELHFPSAVTPAVADPAGGNVTITGVTGATLGILDDSMLPQISYTPNQTGIDILTYMVSDERGGTANGTISIFINPEGNARPALDHIYNTGGRVGVDLNFTATADDSDDTSLTFDIANVPDGASITAGGDFSWRPSESQNGTHTVTFIVHDDSGGADWQHVTVTILRADETNLPPVPQDIDAGVVLGGGRGFQPDIADPENDMTEITRVYDSSLGDVDRSFTSQGIIVYVAGVLGNDEVIYTVSDGRGGFANGTISITVEEPANVRPLIEFVGDKSVNAGDELTFTVDADDLDGLVVDFGLEGDTQGPSMSPLGVFSWTPTANDVGSHEFTILVFDDAGENSTVSITVTVRPEDFENSPPVAPDVVIMTPQDVLSIVRPTLTDPDEGDPVRITQTGDATKGRILSGFLRAGIIIYLPNQGEFGTETIPYTIADSSDGNDTATINVFISARGNTDPILGSIDFRNINAGDPLAFDLEAEDPDGDTISYRPVGAPDGIEISPEGAFSWTPTAADVGNHTFTIVAYDDRGGADSKTAVIRVLPAGTANQAPNAPDSSVTVAPGGSVVITPAISDPDGDRVTITDAVASGTGVVIYSEDSMNYIHVATTPTETITYTVTDARGAVSTGTITVQIGATGMPTAPGLLER